MNMQQIELIAKALAPVIKEHTQEAVEKAESRINQANKAVIDRLDAENKALNVKITELEKTISNNFNTIQKTTDSLSEKVTSDDEQIRKEISEEIRLLHQAYEAGFEGFDAGLSLKLAEIEQKIPPELDKTALLDEFKALIPEQQEVSLDGYIKQIDAELLIEEKSLSLREELQKAIDDIPEPKDGELITVDDVLPHIEAKIAEKIAEIPVPKDGKDGDNGNDGASVTVEDVKPLIDKAVEQIKAEIPVTKPGNDGKPGKDGIDGKDALQIEILPAADMNKTYPRGTYAFHKGGVIRAYQQTQGEKGWETVWNGIDHVEIQQDNARKALVTIHLTDGTQVNKEFNFPAMVHKGVFKDGDTYQQGDTVTWAGSLWYANKDTDTKPNTKDSDWTLVAKRGRDGKNYEPEAK